MKFKILLLLVFPLVVKAQNFNLVSKAVLPNVGYSTVLSFDADNDGLMDVLVMGKAASTYYTKLYHNNGDSTFLDLGIAFPNLAYGSADVLDFNNDGLLDIAIGGSDGVNKRFSLFKNKGHNLFQEVATPIPGVDYCTVKCADLNLDGFTDIVVAGETNSQKIVKIFRNNGNSTFSEVNSLEGMYDGGLQIADINNDGYPDIIACGVDNQFELSGKIYINAKKDFIFTERTSNITAIRGGSIHIFDFNNDGYYDLLVVGKNTDDQYVTEVYKNNNGETFTLAASLKGLYYATAATADFNNDGFADIVLAGLDPTGTNQSLFYKNNAGASFTEQVTNLPKLKNGSIYPFEFLNDNKLDVIISGFTMSGPVTCVYNSKTGTFNTAPESPTNLLSLSSTDSVILRWTAPIDAETTAKGLTYDLLLKKVSNGDTIFVPPSDFISGNRYVNKQGQIQDTFVILKSLPYGKYYWSVQAIDQSYSGSAFAASHEFNVCFNMNIGKDTSICNGSNITLSAGSSSDVVNWYSNQSPLAPFYTGNSPIISVTHDQKIWANIITVIGCNLWDTIQIAVLPLPDTWVKKDTGVCSNSSLTLSLLQPSYLANWSSLRGSITSSNQASVQFRVLFSDTIFLTITDTKGCVNFDTTRLMAYALPMIHLPIDTSLCIRDTLHMLAGGASDTVYWYNRNGILLSNAHALHFYADHEEYLHAKFINNYNCMNFDTTHVTLYPLPIANAGVDTLICPGGTAKLGGYYANPENYTFQWFPSGSLDNIQVLHPNANPVVSSSYAMKITDGNACINHDTVIVHINPPSTIDTGGDRFVCIGKSVVLGGNVTATGSILPYSYKWFPKTYLSDAESSNPTAKPDTTTQYNLEVLTGSCVLDTFPVKVTVWPLPVITKSKDVTIGYLENAHIWASGGALYRWDPATGLDNDNISDPIASPLISTTYTVFVTDSNGCESNTQSIVTIRNELFVPNLFTPNADGNNDYFKIYGTGIDQIHLKIFNTDGVLVFEANNKESATILGWDGTCKGKSVEPGRYLWVLDAISTEGKILLYNNSNKGIITLLR